MERINSQTFFERTMKNIHIIIAVSGLLLVGMNCGKPLTAEALFTQAETKRNVSNNSGAIEDLSKLLELYPDHDLASKTQYFIGDIYMNNIKDFEAAITAYKKVVESYSGSGLEANAQFMVGFIYANYIQNLDSAKKEYDQFLNQFPDHDLYDDVQFELQYLGKDINQIDALKNIAS
jgi:tetratricopeptide (TPR) repeat protein